VKKRGKRVERCASYSPCFPFFNPIGRTSLYQITTLSLRSYALEHTSSIFGCALAKKNMRVFWQRRYELFFTEGDVRYFSFLFKCLLWLRRNDKLLNGNNFYFMQVIYGYIYQLAPFMTISTTCGEPILVCGGVYTIEVHHERYFYPTWMVAWSTALTPNITLGMFWYLELCIAFVFIFHFHRFFSAVYILAMQCSVVNYFKLLSSHY
jgi:hypothetical protein